nr:APC family permease [Candidatus Sigynarchaeota archaeon]
TSCFMMNVTSTTTEKKQSFPRKNSMLSTLLIGISSVLGAGIYVLLAPSARLAGPGIIVAFIIDGIFAIFIAGSYSECVSVLPVNGGGFVFIRSAYGNKGLFLGWVIWLSNIAYGAVCANGIGSFLEQIIGLDSTIFVIGISIVMVLLFTLVNIKGSQGLAKAQNPLLAALMASMVIGCVFLFANPRGNGFSPFLPFGFYPVITSSALLMDIYIGFEDLCAISEEVEAPRKNVPKALFLTVLISAAFYFLIIITVFSTQNLPTILGTELTFLEICQTNPVIYYIVFFGAIFALMTSLGVALMAASRNLYALAIYDFVDRKWGALDKKSGAPVKALFLTCAISVIIVITGQVEVIASISNVSYLITVMFVAFAAIKFRKTKTYEPDSFKMPFYPYSHFITIIMCIFLMIFIEPSSTLVALSWFGVGVVIYLFFSSKKRLYGIFFMIMTFFVLITYLIAGIIIMILGILYYLFNIAENHSRNLIVVGLTTAATIFLAIQSGILLDFGSIQAVVPDNSMYIPLVHTLLILMVVLSITGVFFSIFSPHYLLLKFKMKIASKEIPVYVNREIINKIGLKNTRIIFLASMMISIVQIATSGLLMILALLFTCDIFMIAEIRVGTFIIIREIITFFTLVSLVLAATFNFVSGFSWVNMWKNFKKNVPKTVKLTTL